jgi:DNA-binding CsgD family transcriptional regulator
LDASSSPEIIAEAYRLTPTELRILLAIVEVGGVPDVAVALGIAESTVKTHLGRLFEKTGAGRQAISSRSSSGSPVPWCDDPTSIRLYYCRRPPFAGCGYPSALPHTPFRKLHRVP